MSIKDVARLAGVSPSTVSRVVNSGDISAASSDTQQKIWNAVRSVGYVPNQNARSLKQQSQQSQRITSRDIDCVYARTAGPHIDPFFTTLMHAVEVEAFAHGYNLRYQYSIVDVKSGKYKFPCSTVNSAIVLGRVDAESMKTLRAIYKNIVCASLQMSDNPVDQVVSSGYQACVNCMTYLHSLGHRKICYLGETENEQRYQGYLEKMHEFGTADVSPYVVETAFTPAGGYDAVNDLLERHQTFTAILCANDMLAVGALKALKEHKLHVPRDVSLIGINDMETVRYLDPMLTTVNIPLDEMGKHVAKILIDRINDGHKLPVQILVPNTLIYRESCGPVKSVESEK